MYGKNYALLVHITLIVLFLSFTQHNGRIFLLYIVYPLAWCLRDIFAYLIIYLFVDICCFFPYWFLFPHLFKFQL